MQPEFLEDIICCGLLISRVELSCIFRIVQETLEISILPDDHVTISIREVVESIVSSILNSRFEG